MSNPLDAALAALRDEVRLAEEHLATLSEAPIADQLAAAGDVHAARLRAREGETVLPGSVRRALSDDAAQALAPLFSDSEEPAPPVQPEPGDDPLAALFA